MAQKDKLQIKRISLKEFVSLKVESYEWTKIKTDNNSFRNGLAKRNLSQIVKDEFEEIKNASDFTGLMAVFIHKKPDDLANKTQKEYEKLANIHKDKDENSLNTWAEDLILLNEGCYYDKFLCRTHTGFLFYSFDVVNIELKKKEILLLGEEILSIPKDETEIVYMIDCSEN